MKNKIVIYTAIFGGKDTLMEPKYIPKNCDFVCFTDRPVFSKVWNVRLEKATSVDPVRSAKIYKILPHKFLKDYDISIWVDGNMAIRGDINELIDKYLHECNMAVFDHLQLKVDRRNCIYEEAESLLGSERRGRRRDDPALISRQVKKYRGEGFPDNYGLIVGMVLIRKHNEYDVITAMESWWNEIVNGSRRDQLSFNYVAWKNNFKFCYITGDARDNDFFSHTLHNNHKKNFMRRILDFLFHR